MKIPYTSIMFSFSLGLLILSACEDTPERGEAEPPTYSQANIDDCIRKELSYNPNLDMEHYKSIKTEYFHEIKDYISQEAIELQSEVEQLQNEQKDMRNMQDANDLSYDSLSNAMQKTQKKLDSLKKALARYRKVTVGYVFVHTYKAGEDTMKQIFVMDINCNETEMIPVRSKININPDAYRKQVNRARQGQ